MSPAPYPPLHAGDDVDADFFDQLGDELDFPAQGAVPQKHQDAGLANLGGPPGALVSSGATEAWSGPPKVHPEDVGFPLPQGEESQVGSELEDAFTNLNIEAQDGQSLSRGGSDAHLLSNGDDPGLHHSLVEAVHDSEDRLTGVESSVMSNSHPADDDSAAQLGVSEDPTTFSVPPETIGDGNVEPESTLHGELSFSANLVAEAASVAEEVQRDPVSEDQGDVKAPEASRVQAQTTDVEEVQWSNFGMQGGFGSFSDFLSVYPPDSSQPQDVNAIEPVSVPDDFHPGQQSTSDVGSQVVERGYDDVSFFDLPHPHQVGATHTAEEPPQPSTTTYETQSPLQVNSGEIPAYFPSQGLEQQVQGVQFDPDQWQNTQSQGIEQQIQSDHVDHSQWNNLQPEGLVQQPQYGQPDQGLWQELPEYPGWLYNTMTGVWVEKSNSGTDLATATSGQEGSQDRGGENENIQWQGNQATGNAADANGPTVDPHLGQPTAGTSVTEWIGDQHYAGQTSDAQSALSTDGAGQQDGSGWQESAGEAASGVSQSGWEDQYPGWYWDYSAQEWKESSHLPQVAEEEPRSSSVPDGSSYEQTTHANNLSQEYRTESASVPSVSYEQTTQSNNFSQGYNAGWPTGQDQGYTAVDQYNRDGYGSHNVVSSSLQYDGQRSTQENMTGQWGSVQTQQQFNIPASYYQPGQPLSNGANQQQWDTGNNVQQVNPLKQLHMMPENQYDQHSAGQMRPYAPQPRYPAQHHPQYVPQTAPKSVDEAMRTPVGRPPHVLTAFAFGGKLVVVKLKDPVSLQFSDGNQSFGSGQAFVPGPIQVHSLSQLVSQTSDNGRLETGTSYFGALSRPTLHAPLVGGSVSGKELTKWLDEQAGNCLSEEPNFRSSGSLPMLWGLLKLACKHYGKLRSQSGSAGITSQEGDGAEAALANLLTSGGDQSSWTMGSFSSTVCLQPLPSEHQLQVTASETKKLLVAGKRKEALKIAQQGQLWGPALVLARQLGEKYYSDTVAAMAQRQFLPGSPLRTLSLLLAGQPAEVFSESNIVTSPRNQPMQVPSSSGNGSEGGIGSMLAEWQENLSIMAANRTNGDDRVISHLGDCLWKVKGEVAAAHICYLVADANFESFSSNARLCLVGADHWKNPRTYVSPEAIQRTEVYEYSKVLGNPQFILVPFQPYKIIYASMLAEAGKTAEALRYCQAVSKTLKTASRAPEVETCRLAATALEERLRLHMQGDNSANFAPGKLVRGMFSVLDRNIKNIIGGPPQPTGHEQVQMASTVESVTLQDHVGGGFFGASPSRPPAPLGPSASAEKLKDATVRPVPVRSVSEPDFSTSMKEKAEQGKPITRAGYLGRFGSVFSKAGGIVSMVSKINKKEAKLGDKNKFYFDEKLKRWVEEGAEAPQEEAALPPPPTSANFASKVEDTSSPDVQFGVGLGAAPPASASKNTHLGTPPVPPSNQYSTRARQQGVRSRYVDTFNKGGNSATPSKPAVSAFAPAGRFGGTPSQPVNFFVPASSMDNNMNGSENGPSFGISEENHVDQHSESGSNMQERHQSGMVGSGIPWVPSSENTSAFGPGAIHRVPSSENTTAFGTGAAAQRGGGKLGRSPSNGDIGLSNGYHSRANSWSGYPSNFQKTEPDASYDNPAANFSMYNGFSSQSTMQTTATVGSYFPPPSKGDIYNPKAGTGLNESFASPPSSMTPFMPGIVGRELRPGAMETPGGGEPLAGDDLQEVEL